MPRHPTLRKKKIGKTVYWFTKVGGDTYFGNVKEIAFKDAKKLFNQHLESVLDAQQDRKSRELSAGDLMDLFLEGSWVTAATAPTAPVRRTATASESSRSWARASRSVTGPLGRSEPRTWKPGSQAWRRKDTHARHVGTPRPRSSTAGTGLRSTVRRGRTHRSFSPTFRPFASVERVYVPPKALAENDLSTDDEIKALFVAAEIDLDKFHRFGPKTARPSNEAAVVYVSPRPLPARPAGEAVPGATRLAGELLHLPDKPAGVSLPHL